jgi:hypothetical protein
MSCEPTDRDRPTAPPPPGYPPIGAAIAQRARAISTPPWEPPSGDAFAASIYEQERRAKKSRDITLGAILLVIGIIVTAATYDSASREGGTYIVAWGPMVYGAIRLIKGLAA